VGRSNFRGNVVDRLLLVSNLSRDVIGDRRSTQRPAAAARFQLIDQCTIYRPTIRLLSRKSLAGASGAGDDNWKQERVT